MLKTAILAICAIIIICNYRRKRLLSSNSLWVLCYILIFVFYPVFSDKTYTNEDEIDIWATVGIIGFGIGSFLGSVIKQKKPYENNKYKMLYPQYGNAFSCFWVILTLFLIVMLRAIGSSGIQATIKGRITSNELTWGNSYSGDVFVYLMNLMVPFALTTWVSAGGKISLFKKWICFAVFVFISVIFGYTRLFLICTIICILFYELRNKSVKNQAIVLLVSIVGLAFVMVFLNFVRCLGTGNLNSFVSTIDPAYFFESTDFGASYKWFSELLKIKSPYIFPLTYLKPLFVFIPRSIWPGKPEPLSLDILRILNPSLAASGYSTAGNSVLGEGYAVLGYLGMVIFPIIWGIITVILDKRYYDRLSKRCDGCLRDYFYYYFATFIILSCQRGDWSQYNIIIVWLFMIPLYFISKIKVTFKLNTTKKRVKS